MGSFEMKPYLHMEDRVPVQEYILKLYWHHMLGVVATPEFACSSVDCLLFWMTTENGEDSLDGAPVTCDEIFFP